MPSGVHQPATACRRSGEHGRRRRGRSARFGFPLRSHRAAARSPGTEASLAVPSSWFTERQSWPAILVAGQFEEICMWAALLCLMLASFGGGGGDALVHGDFEGKAEGNRPSSWVFELGAQNGAPTPESDV